MKKLLVIADKIQDSQEALKKAMSLAKKAGAAIHVAIFEYELKAVLMAVSSQNPDFSGADLKTQMINRKKQWWQEYIQRHRGDLEITYEVIWDKYIPEWVVKHSGRHHYDLVIKTGNRSESAFYTPTDWQLFRDSTIPVYIVSLQHFKPKKVILVAIDILARSAKKKNLNRQVIESANRLALQTDTDTYIAKSRKQVAPFAASLAQDYKVLPERIHIEEGLPWGVVANLGKKLRAQCVVAGSLGRKGITGKLIGNTAENIIRIANTDLLVVSPEVQVV